MKYFNGRALVSAQKEGALADSQHKVRFLIFVRNDKRCCYFERSEKSLAPGTIAFPRIIEQMRLALHFFAELISVGGPYRTQLSGEVWCNSWNRMISRTSCSNVLIAEPENS